MGQICGDQVIPGAHSSLGSKSLAGVMRRKFVGTTLLRLTGSGANWWRRQAEPVWVCVLRLSQTAHSRQPPPPADFSLEFKDDA